MLTENTIDVCVKDHTDDRSAQVRLGLSNTIAQVRPQILERLAMPLESESGDAITYVMYNESYESQPYLKDDEYVEQVLTSGQNVRVVPEIIAGEA